MKKFILAVLFLSITACVPSKAQIEAAAIAAETETQAAIPTPTRTPIPTITPTPTLIPLSGINFDNLLLLDGDLPQGYIYKPITDDTNSINENITGQDKRASQEFSKEGTGFGIVSVFLFEAIEKRDQAYNLASGEVDKVNESVQVGQTQNIDLKDIGEKGRLTIHTILSSRFSTLMFVRCHAYVYLSMTNDDELSSVTKSYARKLDARLTNVICR